MDMMGVARTIDHAVYTLLNSLAMVLWRLDSAILGMAMLSYDTQDWLTGRDGGVWLLLDKISGPDGLLGLTTWQLFLTLALMLFGLSLGCCGSSGGHRRSIWGQLFFFGVLSYLFISRGSALMQEAEAWREEAGGWMYEAMAGESGPRMDIPGGAGGDEPLGHPQDLDGERPIRGWEAVSGSYFLVESMSEFACRRAAAGIPESLLPVRSRPTDQRPGQ